MRTLLVAALLATALLAGCSGKATGNAGSSLDQAAKDLDVKATATTGVIRGVVVDTAIRPVVGLKVTTQSKGQAVSAETSNAGAFAFEGLAAGTYFLKTHKAGYEDTQTSVDVAAGESAPAVTKIQVTADPSSKPSVDLFHFKGFMECSAVAGTPLTGGFFTPCENPATGAPVGNENSHTAFNVTGNTTWVQGTLIWNPTNPLGAELYYNLFYSQSDYPASIVGFGRGPSPLQVDVNGTDANKFGESGHILFEGAASRSTTQGFLGAAFQQDFDAYIVVFHGFAPPAGYSFAKDGAPHVPA
ncbi:MAG: Carboxypeptidase regulatory-like domain [Thermoplasmata archaeon]|jgi:hypothetical protein|nr:Carboxypeptidase regulatory-like domain [Thermoplasmata archaeon]